nr:PepSY domain-containing protein [Ardenticatena sp.]
MNRLAFFISAVLTSFMLVVAGALVGQLSENPTAADSTSPPQDVAAVQMPVEQPAPQALAPEAANTQVDPVAAIEQSLMPAVENIVQQREAQYRQLLDEANRQLQAAYAKQQELAAIAQQAQAAQAQAEQLAQQMAEQLAAVQAAQAQAQAAAVAQPQPATANTEPAIPQYPVTAAQAAGIAQSVANGAALTGQPELVLFEGTPAYEVPFDRGMIYVDATTGAVLYNGTTPPPAVRDDDDDDEEYEEREDRDDDDEREDDDDHEEREDHEDEYDDD